RLPQPRKPAATDPLRHDKENPRPPQPRLTSKSHHDRTGRQGHDHPPDVPGRRRPGREEGNRPVTPYRTIPADPRSPRSAGLPPARTQTAAGGTPTPTAPTSPPSTEPTTAAAAAAARTTKTTTTPRRPERNGNAPSRSSSAPP